MDERLAMSTMKGDEGKEERYEMGGRVDVLIDADYVIVQQAFAQKDEDLVLGG